MQSTAQSPSPPAGESDAELLHEYVQLRSEASFAALVTRHSAWVHAVAQRCLSDPDAAREAAQNVFISLARKAARVNSAALAPWLHRATVLECKNALRREQNRRKALTTLAEQASRDSAEVPAPEPAWKAAEPLLDDALDRLPGRDRALVVMRYFQRQSWREIGSALGRSEDAARMAMGPALERLTNLLRRRGVAVPLAALTTLLLEAGNSTAPAVAAKIADTALHSTHGKKTASGWRAGAGIWLGTAACLTTGVLGSYWLLPVKASDEGNTRASRVKSSIPQSLADTTTSAERKFHLETMLAELRTLEPAGNDPPKVVRLRAACAAMPAEAVPAVLAVMRTRRWYTDTISVADAFFERWGQLDPEKALPLRLDPDFGGVAQACTAAVFRGMDPQDPDKILNLLNTLPQGDAFDPAAAEAALYHFGELKVHELLPLIAKAGSPHVRSSLVANQVTGLNHYVAEGDIMPVRLSAEEYAALAPATLTLKSREHSRTVRILTEAWSSIDEPGATAWIQTLPEDTLHRWAALTGMAVTVARRDPARAMQIVTNVPWASPLHSSLEFVAQRWLSSNPDAGAEWLETANIPVSERAKLGGKKQRQP